MFFGDSPAPPKIITNQTGTSCSPGTLEYDSTYYWRIVSWDDWGASAEGPLWHFSTELDLVPPQTTISFNGTSGNINWYISPVLVSLNASDAQSGVNFTRYSLDNGSWLNYTAPFLVQQDAAHRIRYFSVDAVGNTEDTQTAILKIDQTPPLTTVHFSGNMGSNDWYVGNFSFWFSVIDYTSGVAFTYYSFDGIEFSVCTGPVVVEDGVHELYFFSVDIAGNVEEMQGPIGFKTDCTPPVVALTKEHTGLFEIRFTADVSDGASGVARVVFALDGMVKSNVIQPPYEWTWDGAGNHTVTVIAYDYAGNFQSQSMSTALVQNQVNLPGQIIMKRQAVQGRIVESR